MWKEGIEEDKAVNEGINQDGRQMEGKNDVSKTDPANKDRV